MQWGSLKGDSLNVIHALSSSSFDLVKGGELARHKAESFRDVVFSVSPILVEMAIQLLTVLLSMLGRCSPFPV